LRFRDLSSESPGISEPGFCGHLHQPAYLPPTEPLYADSEGQKGGVTSAETANQLATLKQDSAWISIGVRGYHMHLLSKTKASDVFPKNSRTR
jgi:hypothetical protein